MSVVKEYDAFRIYEENEKKFIKIDYSLEERGDCECNDDGEFLCWEIHGYVFAILELDDFVERIKSENLCDMLCEFNQYYEDAITESEAMEYMNYDMRNSTLLLLSDVSRDTSCGDYISVI